MPAGTIVTSGSLVSPGGQQGIPGPNAVSSDAGNVATWGTDGRLYVPDPSPTIWSQRLRSFNAVGNPNFEVDQRNVNSVVSPGSNTFLCDRWFYIKAGTMTVNTQCGAGFAVLVPGTNFRISNGVLGVTLITQEATLAAGDYLQIVQSIEGPLLRELIGDVTSFSLLASTNIVGGLKFSVALLDPAAGHSLCKLCTIPGGSVWTLIQFANLPLWSPAGNWNLAPGSVGYYLRIGLAVGSTYMAPTNDTWQNGFFFGAVGMDNFASKPVNSNFQLAFIQHEPGPLCTTPIDEPFTQNYDECLRYYCKSYSYAQRAPTAGALGLRSAIVASGAPTAALAPIVFPKAMAKTPGVSIYANDGIAAAVLVVGGANASVSSIGQVSDAGFGQINFPSALTANQQVQFHYVADTGW